MEEPLLSTQTKVTFTDLQIIEGLKKGGDEKIMRVLQNQFFEKYKRYLYKVAIHACSSYPDSQQLALDITQQTFINAFRKIKEFDLSREPNQNKHHAIFKAWLGRIAHNCFLKELARRKAEVLIDDFDNIQEGNYFDMFDSLYDSEPVEIHNEFRMILNEVMNTLTEFQKTVILTYAGEGCLESKHHLSDSAMKYLCTLYDTSPANIRQIKKRVLDKIKNHCFPIKN